MNDLLRCHLEVILTGEWTDVDGRVRVFSDAQDPNVAAGNCQSVNGEIASALAELGHDVKLVDLAGRPWENHCVVDVGGWIVDAAWSQFGDAGDWPVVMERAGYLAWSCFDVVAEEAIR